MTQEFYISVTPVREDEYWIRTERVSPGVPLAEELVTWNVDEWLAQAGQLMHDPLLGLLRGHFPGRSTSGDPAESSLSHSLLTLGQTLYNALFQGTIRDSWVTAQGVAQNRREDLRLRLGLRGDRLPRLPWEVLNAGGRPLATGTDVIFSRYQSAFAPMATVLQSQPLPTLEKNQPLKILMVLAAPTDQEVLALRQEANHLNEELQREQATRSGNAPLPAIELTILDQPGREQLTQALEQGCYQVLHYAGHSNLGESGGDLYLVSDKTGLTEVLSGDDLAGLLVNNGIRMAVFNSCRGVYTATSDPTSEAENGNLADALLRRGVPAVLAMAERIPDDVALTLSRLFYRNLRQRSSIDLSLSRARQGLLSSYGSNQLYWALPILYLHPDFDGYLQPPLDPDSAQTRFEERPIENRPAVPSASMPLRVTAPLDSDEIDHYEEPDEADRDAVLDLFKQLSGETANPFGETSGDQALFEEQAEQEPNPIELQLNGAEDYITLGDMLFAQGNVAGAIGVYGDAIQLSPSAEAYSKLGIALEAYGDQIPQAIAAYQLALRLEPHYEHVQQNLQRLYKTHNLPNSDLSSQSDLETLGSQSAIAQQAPAPMIQPSQPAPFGLNTVPFERIYGQMPTKRKLRLPWKSAIAGVGIASAVVLGIWGVSKFSSSPSSSPDDLLRRIPSLDQPSTSQTSTNPAKADTNSLTGTATTNFSQGNLKAGQEAVEELLDRGALPAAGSALQTLPAEKDVPATSFLRGRLAWQFMKTRNINYSAVDARRFWETAVRKPDPGYYTALGFAYYREGNLKRASDAWIQAIALDKEQQKSRQGDIKTPSQQALVAYSGLALVAIKSAPGQPADRQARFKGEAVKLRDQVLRQAPIQFQPDALAKDWLWSEEAIADWKALLAVKS
ncbi:CHAT domain-containing protein [Phormidesmis priestleyi ULC007]|uniref:CHAT domain-containing protein n=1 Tax=Phormidesmis priestleyi ULC007 TaxID=1920490 RepID=A0A2T1DDB9_9CYAN|nr:CHAT domain-containing protein [Phormidesmis priestleyi]PSB18478.1 CHAT domain-containing protein [Phormidesmis priestleyi ULC007]PZO48795.1 MAG: CHAT domain-containing protein [Phormidesmis priestleyi]